MGVIEQHMSQIFRNKHIRQIEAVSYDTNAGLESAIGVGTSRMSGSSISGSTLIFATHHQLCQWANFVKNHPDCSKYSGDLCYAITITHTGWKATTNPIVSYNTDADNKISHLSGASASTYSLETSATFAATSATHIKFDSSSESS